MFFGQFQHRLNQKNQLTVPVRFRQLLGDQGKLNLVHIVEGRLFVYTQEETERIYAELRRKLGPARHDQLDAITSRFVPTDIDSQGRIVIPKHLKEAVGIEADVVVVGNGRRITIWPLAAWQKFDANLDESRRQSTQENMDVFL